MSDKAITTRKEDYAKWYLDIIKQADLAEHSSVRGCMVIKPYGYAIWENMQKILDKMFKDTGHENAYFPLLIPKSFLSKEADHVEGFAKECAVVTHHRLKADPEGNGLIVDPEAKLSEEFVIRPTSETIIYDTFSRWVTSYRDLPLLINQWANVMRWEMRTRFFLRTAEFLWQEGHTAHCNNEEAAEEVEKMLKVYTDFAENFLAVSVVPGLKSESEKFAGADYTYTIEAMMQDGKALQMGTAHNLGQNFAKAFDVTFVDQNGETKHVFNTSWGVSTRMIGALIMSHSDDKGLVLPPLIAPIKVVIVPIMKDENKDMILSEAEKIVQLLQDKGIAVKLDTREHLSPGAKFNEWEKKGVPVRLEIGPRDVENKQVVFVRRDKEEKETVPQDGIQEKIITELDAMQIAMLLKSKKFREENTVEVKTYDEFKETLEKKNVFILAYFCEDMELEDKIAKETTASIRCIPFDQNNKGKCMMTGKEGCRKMVFAKAY